MAVVVVVVVEVVVGDDDDDDDDDDDLDKKLHWHRALKKVISSPGKKCFTFEIFINGL